MVGVDLSARMVEQAEAKNLYDELIVGEILAELRAMAGVGLGRIVALCCRSPTSYQIC